MLSFPTSNEAEKINMSLDMTVLKEAPEVENRLKQWDVTVEDMLDVVKAAVGARRSATALHPLGAGGQLAYIYGTAALRSLFMPKGWQKKSTGNIECVFNSMLGVKIIYQNANRAGDTLFPPTSASPKGPGSVKVVQSAQGELFESLAEAEAIEETAAVYYLFVEAEGKSIRAELSRPKAILDDQFHGFHERIILLRSGEWEGIDLTPDEMPAPEFDIEVTRKGP